MGRPASDAGFFDSRRSWRHTRGAALETWAVSEVLKSRLHHARPADLFFYRDAKGAEVDPLIQRGHEWAGSWIPAVRGGSRALGVGQGERR